jgi:hypothetical protein
MHYQRLCAWAGPFCAFLWIIALVALAHFVPPPHPADSTSQIVHLYQSHLTGIRLGMVVLLVGGVLYQPWVSAIAVQMKRIEGRQSPLTYVQFGLGTLFVLLFVLAAIFWQVAAYRPTEDPVFTQRMNDLGWFMFLISVPIVTIQGFALSFVIFQDKQQVLFPRWFAWFNIWAQVSWLCGCFIPLVKRGPIGWNGLLSFYMPAAIYTVWMCLLTWLLLRAANVPDSALSNHIADNSPQRATETAPNQHTATSIPVT